MHILYPKNFRAPSARDYQYNKTTSRCSGEHQSSWYSVRILPSPLVQQNFLRSNPTEPSRIGPKIRLAQHLTLRNAPQTSIFLSKNHLNAVPTPQNFLGAEPGFPTSPRNWQKLTWQMAQLLPVALKHPPTPASYSAPVGCSVTSPLHNICPIR